jgi:hypothetical protein
MDTPGSGYIKLFRKLTEWEWYDQPATKVVFIHCLLKANWQEKTWRGKTIKPTQYDKKQDRKKCFAKWKRLSHSDKDKIFQTLPAYIASTPDKQFRKNPLTYMNGEVWNDEVMNPSTSTAEKIDFTKYSPAGV